MNKKVSNSGLLLLKTKTKMIISILVSKERHEERLYRDQSTTAQKEKWNWTKQLQDSSKTCLLKKDMDINLHEFVLTHCLWTGTPNGSWKPPNGRRCSAGPEKERCCRHFPPVSFTNVHQPQGRERRETHDLNQQRKHSLGLLSS